MKYQLLFVLRADVLHSTGNAIAMTSQVIGFDDYDDAEVALSLINGEHDNAAIRLYRKLYR